MSVVISVSIPEETNQFLSTLDNKSEYIVKAIENYRGKSEKSLVELALELNELCMKSDQLENKIVEMMDMQMRHKDDIKVSELQTIEETQTKKLSEEKEFLDKWCPILDPVEELKNLKIEDIDPSSFVSILLPIIEKLARENIRIGISQVRKYLILRSSYHPIIPSSPI